MIDEHTETQASLYALGALPDDEARGFEAALRAEPQLRVLVQEFRATAAALAVGFPRTNPPADLKAKVIAAIDAWKPAPASVASRDSAQPPGWMDWMPWALAACFAVLCVVLISLGKNLHQQALALSERLEERAMEADDLKGRLEQLQLQAGRSTTNYELRIQTIEKQAVARIEELARQTAALTNQLFAERADLKRRLGISEASATQLARDKKTLEEALQILQISGGDRFNNAKIAIMQPTPDGPSGALGASVWIAQDQRGVIALEKLPAVANPAAQDYQLWLIDPNSPSPISAGVFLPDASGSVRFPFSAASVKAVDRFAVSIEPKGGAPRPTGRIVLTGG